MNEFEILKKYTAHILSWETFLAMLVNLTQQFNLGIPNQTSYLI